MFAVATLTAYLQTCAPSVSPDTMRAIVSVESHGYIYAINDNTSHSTYCVPGAASYPCSRDQAASLADKAVRSGHSVDVGIAQVNSGNFTTYGVTAAQMLDPCVNLQVGSKILTNSYRHSTALFSDRRAALWHAIMAYNTGSLYAGEDYVKSVVAAAFDVEVPSIAILGDSGRAVRRPAAIVAPHPRPVTQERVNQSQASPRLSPLLAQGLNSSPSRVVPGTLTPALSH